MSTNKFVVARYYFQSLFKDKANSSFIKDITKEPVLEELNFNYALGNFNAEEHEGKKLLMGTFGRIRRGELAEVYNKKTKEFKKEQLPEHADAMLSFIIHHDSHLMFVEYDSRITPSLFSDKFKKIYSNTSSLSDLEIDFIIVEKDVYKSIKQWDIVNRVIFKKLRPSNPSSLDNFKEIEELLKQTHSTNTNIEFNATSTKGSKKDEKKQGLNYESDLIKQSLALSAYGYGEARLTGTKDGKPVEVETKKFLEKIEVDFSEEGALKKITKTINKLESEEKND